jgi:hypothetical protein
MSLRGTPGSSRNTGWRADRPIASRVSCRPSWPTPRSPSTPPTRSRRCCGWWPSRHRTSSAPRLVATVAAAGRPRTAEAASHLPGRQALDGIRAVLDLFAIYQVIRLGGGSVRIAQEELAALPPSHRSLRQARRILTESDNAVLIHPAQMASAAVERARPPGARLTVSFGGTAGPTLARRPWRRPEAARLSLQPSPPIPRAAPRYSAPPADRGAQPEGPAASRPGPWPPP